MNNVIPVKSDVSAQTLEQVLISGDLSSLSSEQKLSYMKNVCESLGLNPLTKPFDYIRLNNRLTLYATKACTDQLRSVHKVSVTIAGRQTIEGVHVVTARAKLLDGREDESTGAVTVVGLKGDALANAIMKAETKAKRRVTLSICGLGMLDESEVETIPHAKPPVEKEPLSIEPASSAGDYVVKFGKKHKGKKLKEIPKEEINNFSQWLLDQQTPEKPLTAEAREFLEHAEAYLIS